MDEPAHPLSVDHLTDLLEAREYGDAAAYLARFESTSADDRKALLQALRPRAKRDPAALEPLLSALTTFLTDSERSIRLTTVKLFVAVADAEPDAVVALVPSLADRLADAEEFYYVRARAAEALGYVALEHPDAVASPDVLADLRVGLSFDEPEVTEKLAKALEYVALGDPGRLRHHVSDLADHLDDDAELVRYHLTTALVAVGCEHPTALAAGCDALEARLDDENAYIRGRAAEALGLLARSSPTDASGPDDDPNLDLEKLEEPDGDDPFMTDRVQFAADARSNENDDLECSDGVGTVETIREETDDIVAEITSPDGACPRCGLALPESGPPMCPRCGAPY